MNYDFPLVPRHRDASITDLGGTEFHAVASALESHLDVRRWTRNNAIEKRINDHGHGRYAVFLREAEPSAGIPSVNLFMAAGRSNDVSISNIVPTESGSIDVGQFNAVLMDFMTNVGRPAGTELGAKVNVSGPEYDLRVELGKEPAELLVSFSTSANKSTGSSHPLDRDRWYSFLVAAHSTRDDAASLANVIGEWLELEGWSSEIARELVIQFEFSMGLLNRA